MEKEIVEVKAKESKRDSNNFPSRSIKIIGSSASIAIIVIILKALNFIPSSVALSLGLFASLPLIYSFVFGIIFNRPNFGSVLRHYSFAIYIIAALVIHMVVLKPDSLELVIRYFFHFLIGFVLAMVGYFCYTSSYRIASKKLRKYRWRALIGFIVSLLIMFGVSFVLYHYEIFKLI